MFELADELDQNRFYRFAKQLRAATLSITNNIARRSVFEVANILILLTTHNKLPTPKASPLLSDLEEISRMILAFIRHLKS